jgi:putative hemolysin
MVVLTTMLLASTMMLFMNSGGEIAFFSLGISDLKNMRQKRYPSAGKILKLLSDPSLLLSAMLAGNLFYRIMIILICNQLIVPASFPYWPVWLTVLIKVTVVLIILLLIGEFLPKVWASHNPMRFAFYASWMVRINYTLFRLPGKWLTGISKKVEHALGWENGKRDRLHQIDEVIAVEEGIGTSEEEKNMLKGIAAFGDINVRRAMRSRLDVQGIEDTTPFEALKARVGEQQYSRFPVYKGSLDSIAGILYAKDLIPYLDQPDSFDWKPLLRPPFFIHEQMLVKDLLKEFQTRQIHMAIVVDEFGGTDGIITMEDILEEIVGEIRDEFDDEESSNVRIDDNNFIFEGRIMISDACKMMQVPPKVFDSVRGSSETIAGLVLEIAGEIPQQNQVFSIKEFSFTILEVSLNRIQKLKVTIDPSKA